MSRTASIASGWLRVQPLALPAVVFEFNRWQCQRYGDFSNFFFNVGIFIIFYFSVDMNKKNGILYVTYSIFLAVIKNINMYLDAWEVYISNSKYVQCRTFQLHQYKHDNKKLQLIFFTLFVTYFPFCHWNITSVMLFPLHTSSENYLSKTNSSILHLFPLSIFMVHFKSFIFSIA